MMGSTYEEVKEKADHRWKLERARIIASLESEMQLHEFEEGQNRYYVRIKKELVGDEGQNRRGSEFEEGERYLQRQEFVGDEVEPDTDKSK